METLVWIAGSAVAAFAALTLIVWLASRARFDGRHAGGGLAGSLGVVQDFYQPQAVEAHAAQEEEKRRIVSVGNALGADTPHDGGAAGPGAPAPRRVGAAGDTAPDAASDAGPDDGRSPGPAGSL
ncbi:hypothetical protein ACX8Z9_09260 [Arthrobacter halodurans]|uniref:Uncharacterized protein n=1 Tax=Arthrobacter halodurans TaxID=516699 RepID=A0ABV4UQB8_9MICC